MRVQTCIHHYNSENNYCQKHFTSVKIYFIKITSLGSCYVEHTFEIVALLYGLTLKLVLGYLVYYQHKVRRVRLNNINCYSTYLKAVGKFTNGTKLT